MDAAEFAHLQDALMWALGPMALWMCALLLAGGFLSGILVAWLAMLRKLSH